jgi:cation diffusion facilitator CzcD-associated flavoprotein CzcO
MAFVDTLLSETDSWIVMVDRRDRPGGHWNDAYPFVGLHQPAAFYGVASRELSEWRKDETGLNAGFYSLSTGTGVLSHFEQVMRQRFLPSGRVVFREARASRPETRWCVCPHVLHRKAFALRKALLR